jgi:hypothetical protein
MLKLCHAVVCCAVFSPPPAGSSCVDSLTGVPITFPMIQQVPATLAATITAISLLSEPAKSDPTVREVVSREVCNFGNCLLAWLSVWEKGIMSAGTMHSAYLLLLTHQPEPPQTTCLNPPLHPLYPSPRAHKNLPLCTVGFGQRQVSPELLVNYVYQTRLNPYSNPAPPPPQNPSLLTAGFGQRPGLPRAPGQLCVPPVRP